jgi:hypothetical protein
VSGAENFAFPAEMHVDYESVCVLFDPGTGRIAHTHRVVTLQGAERASEADVEARAREAAKQLGRDLPDTEVLHLGGDAMREPGIYSVDPESRSLVLSKPPEREL